MGSEMNLEEKVRELVAMHEALPDGAVEAEAQAFLAQARGWSIETQVPLSRVAYVLAHALLDPDPNVRRVVVSDGLQLRSAVG
jgi:hypothetical protein